MTANRSKFFDNYCLGVLFDYFLDDNRLDKKVRKVLKTSLLDGCNLWHENQFDKMLH